MNQATLLIKWGLMLLFTAIGTNAIAQAPPPIPGNHSVCINTTKEYGVVLTAGSTYAWSITPSTGFTMTPNPTYPNLITVTWTAVGEYTMQVIETNAAGCVGDPVTIVITVNPLPTVTVNSPTVCAGTPATITATPGEPGTYSYAWTVPSGVPDPGNVASFTSTVAGTYSVVITNTATGCGSASASGTVTVNELPVCSITGNDNMCPGSTNTYSGPSGMSTYSWSISGNATITGAANGQTVSVLANNSCGTFTLTLTVTDANGCTSTCSQTFNITDTEAPVITLTASTAVICNPTADQIAAAFGTASVTDNCSTGLTATFTDGAETGTGCDRSITRTWTVTDACGNTATQTQTITFTRDTEAPVITLTASTAVICNPTADQIAAAFGTASVTDNCSTGLTATFTDGAETGTGCDRSITRTWTVTDACGNTATQTQTITFTRDTEAPVITLTASTAVICNPTADQIAAAFGTASVTDNCSTGLTATFTDGAETGTGCDRSITRTWTVTDACGNTATQTQTITFTRDTEAPVITLTASTAVICNPTADQIAAAFGTASVTDNCSTGLTATFTDGAETGTGCDRSITRTWTVTDACGNTATQTQTITFTRDTEAPVITLTASTAVICNPTADQIAAAFGTASVTDNCSTGLTATFTDGAETGTGCDRSITRTWTVTDACGNTATQTQTITFTRDTEAPVITLTASTAVICNPTADQIAAAFGTASVTDNCSTGLTATFTDGAETGTGCDRSITRTWTVTDACGNTATQTQTITFTRDTEAPVITLTASTAVICNPTADQIAAAFGTASVTDNCSTGLTATFTDGAETGTGCDRSITRTWTVTDACGNTATQTQTITFTRDTEAPVITLTASTAVICNPTADQIAAAFGTASVTDNCSTGLTATFTDGAETGTGCDRSITRTWTVTDACGNTATQTQTITFTRDTEAPVITLTASTAVICNPTADQIAAAFGTASVTDNCSTGLTATFTDGAETGTGCDRSITRTWTVTDACGNTATQTQTITFTRDTEAPVITLTASTALVCNPTADQIAAAFGTASVTDNCSTGLTATFTDGAETGTGCDRSITRTWTVTDACGNTATQTQTITFTRDTEAPVITLTASTAVICNPTADQIAAAFGTASVTDNCSTGLTATFTDGAETGTGCDRSITRTWTVTDACGNTATQTQTITFTRDTEAPVITLTASTAVICNPTADQIAAAFGTASVTDNCSTGLTATFTDGAE
ncbi:beta strand repeat-containing protein, partial [Longitalea arenae]|uniref:beta strand repeat-containing protein n=1 Tax=Longitalea arenae TaxID=2812558 RepID=UPI0019675F86